MSLMTIAEQLALNVGLPVPINLSGGLSRDWREIVQFANEAGEEISRRAQWGALTRTEIMPGSGPLPYDFDRLIDGLSVMAGGRPVRALSQEEWLSLPAQTGTPRYYLLRGDSIEFWPNGPASITFQSRNWAGGSDRLAAADDTPVFDEALLVKAVVVRWRRQKGLPYADEEAEFEAALAAAPLRGHGFGQGQGTDYVAIYEASKT